MSKQSRKQKSQEDLAGCIGSLIAIPVVAFLGFQIFFSGGESKPTETKSPQTRTTYTSPTPEEKASRKCLRAVKRKYAPFGYDAFRLASQRVTATQRDDGMFFATIAVPFKTTDAITGKRNRVFWVNVECVVDDSVLPTITETDTAGYPG